MREETGKAFSLQILREGRDHPKGEIGKVYDE